MIGTPTVCIRVDDLHGRAPRHVVPLVAEVFAGRALTWGVIPSVGRAPFRIDLSHLDVAEIDAFVDRDDLIAELLERGALGAAEVAVHGITHADDGVRAELECPSAEQLDALLAVCRAWRDRFGTSVVIPPHNAMADDAVKTMLDNGVHVSRSIPAAAITALGLDPEDPADRRSAKRLCPAQVTGRAVDLYQTAAISRRGVTRRQLSAASVAADVLAVAAGLPVVTLTFHWWDFFDDATTFAPEFAGLCSEVVDRLDHALHPRWETIGRACDGLVEAATHVTHGGWR